MRVEQSFSLPQPPATVWPAFGDVPLLVQCLPGASLAGDPVEGAWPLRFDVKLGPIAASFQGQGRLQRDESTFSGVFEGQASDRKTGSRVKGQASFRLLPTDGGGTQVDVAVEHQLSGSLAQFGRAGLVKQLAGALAEQFAERLRAQLAAAPSLSMPGDDGAAAPDAPVAVGAAAGSPPAAPLSAASLIWRALRRWWSGLWSGPAQRSGP